MDDGIPMHENKDGCLIEHCKCEFACCNEATSWERGHRVRKSRRISLCCVLIVMGMTVKLEIY